MLQRQADVSQIRWLRCRSPGVAGPVIPPFACLLPLDATVIDGEVTLLVGQHVADSADLFCFNGPQVIQTNGAGICTFHWPAHALYQGGPPVPGARWGTKSGSWAIDGTNGRHGLLIVGGAVTDANGSRVLVVPEICYPV